MRMPSQRAGCGWILAGDRSLFLRGGNRSMVLIAPGPPRGGSHVASARKIRASRNAHTDSVHAALWRLIVRLLTFPAAPDPDVGTGTELAVDAPNLMLMALVERMSL